MRTRGSVVGAAALVVVLLVSSSGSSVAGPTSSPGPIGASVSAPSGNPAPSGDSSEVVVAPAISVSGGDVEVGPVPSATSMSVAVGIAPSDPSGLAAYATAVSTPGTPLYGHYLTAGALTSRYGPTASTVAGAERYFRSYGLHASANSDGLLLSVVGSAAALGAAFSTTFAEYRSTTGREFVSHPTPAVLPAIAPWSGAYGLGNVTPLVPAIGSVAPATSTPGPATGCVGQTDLYSPCQIATAYDEASLLSAGTNGTGRTIAVVDAYSAGEPQGQLASDLVRFDSAYDLPTGSVQFAYPVPTTADLNASGTNSAWTTEEALDLEWAHASAPGADLIMTFSPNSGAGLYEAVDWLVANDAANVISMSWGEPDSGVYNSYSGPCASECNASTDGSYAVLAPVLELAAAEGISVFAASGDCGAADGTSGVATNFPASDPYVVGVGGTELTASSNGTYEDEIAWSGNATGAVSPGCQNQGGSGGGYAPFPRPWWQVGLAAGSSHRGVPDVALDAGVPVVIYQAGSLEAVEGTSVATPIWAGFAAVADQAVGASLGFLDPRLYAISIGPEYDRDFHDIDVGSNGYSAGTGWDPVTGLGTPIVAELVANLTAASLPVNGPGATVFASPRFGPAPLTVRFSLTTPTNGSYPLEGVAFGDGNASFAPNGTVSHTYGAPGVYAAQSYVMDAGGNLSVSSPVVVVVGGGGPLSVGLSSNATSVPAGGSVTFSAAVSGGVAPYSYRYWFGDGTFQNSTSDEVVHTFRAAGGFCASVVVTDSAVPPDGGASSRIAISVGGATAPACGNDVAAITVIPTPQSGPWDAPADLPDLFAVAGGAAGPDGVGVGLTYTSSDPYVTACDCAIFRSAGTYSVHVLVSDAVNSFAYAETNVTISAALSGTFTASALFGPAPLTVTFAASVSGGVDATAAATQWEFGNGQGAVGAQVSATYASAGAYLAAGRVGDGAHGNASEAFLIDVAPTTGPAPLGVVGTIAPATHLLAGSTVAFAGRAVGNGSVGAGAPVWQVDSGSLVFAPAFNRTYFGPPTAADWLNGTVSVGGASGPVVPFALPAFVATLPDGEVLRSSALTLTDAVSPLAGVAPAVVDASANATGPGGTAVAWSWGDGTQTNGTPAAHVYEANGSFLVTVRASDPWGDVAFDAWGVAIGAALTAAGGPNVGGGIAPLTVVFSAVPAGGSGPPYTLAWTFGDGTNGTGSPVDHTYDATGLYGVVLTVTDSQGHVTTRTWRITVLAVPTGSFPVVVVVGIGVAAVAVGVALALLLGRRPRSPGGPGAPLSP